MTYDYKYLDTGETFELEQSMRDAPLTEHNNRPVKRLITGGSGTVFKGLWNDNADQYTVLRDNGDGSRRVLGDGSVK